jgi:hypothetical protein
MSRARLLGAAEKISAMELRKLGDSELFISRVGLCCNNFGPVSTSAGVGRSSMPLLDAGRRLLGEALRGDASESRSQPT